MPAGPAAPRVASCVTTHLPAHPPEYASARAPAAAAPLQAAVPAYLEQVYWWAYVHPNAVRVFERPWLVNLILFGNYTRLCDAALGEIGADAAGATLQIACVYGELTPRLLRQIASDGALHVVDVLPVQLENLRAKLPPDERVALFQRDSSALGFADASYERVLLFFLLHEMPDDVRRATLAEAYRVLKPGGKIVLVDYHRPNRSNPLRRPMQALLRRLEPFAEDLWQHELTDFFPAEAKFASVRKELYFGGLYQKVVMERPA
ncbi:MAG: class I SAM-dependent methyltransferase [Burkholderiaceae bacterium]|nr:class I SAM-dependent methyltransferase [Burkholderiaceae bacterium]